VKYVKLGHTGTDVSAIAVGCMSYGESNRGLHGWTLPEEESRCPRPSARYVSAGFSSSGSQA